MIDFFIHFFVYLSLVLIFWVAVDQVLQVLFRMSRVLRDIRHLLETIVGSLNPVGDHIVFYELIGGKEVKVENTMIKKADQPFRLKLAIKDSAGNPAPVDGAPVWAVSDPALCDIVVDDGGMAAAFTPKGVVGDFEVQVSADADLGEGVVTILGLAQVTIIAAQAVTIEISEE